VQDCSESVLRRKCWAAFYPASIRLVVAMQGGAFVVDLGDARQGPAHTDRRLSSFCHSTCESHIPDTDAALMPSRGTTPTRTGRTANKRPFSQQSPSPTSRNDDKCHHCARAGKWRPAHSPAVARLPPPKSQWAPNGCIQLGDLVPRWEIDATQFDAS
jgi:hypothetical protein